MTRKPGIQDLLEQSEDRLFQRIVDEQEGGLGLTEAARTDGPSQAALDQWTARLDKLEQQQPSPTARRRNWTRLALVAAILAAVLALSAMAFHKDILNVVETVRARFTQLSPVELPETVVAGWMDAYLPTYIPDDYMMSDATDTGDFRFVEYTDPQGNCFAFYHYGSDTVAHVDTEAADTQSCQIGIWPGLLVKKDGLSTLYWSIENTSFSIEYDSAQINDKTVLKIADSTAMVQKEGVQSNEQN